MHLCKFPSVVFHTMYWPRHIMIYSHIYLKTQAPKIELDEHKLNTNICPVPVNEYEH